ncbi:MAG: glutathione S-transferase C-terminal domain-containing protein [Halioglobus sp.]|nr:glutathione S-transferase C-terminal domain-containing protein [Halioglobus sp.]
MSVSGGSRKNEQAMPDIVLWGVTASPYQLKMQSLLDYAGLSWERWPEQTTRSSALLMALRLQWAKRRGAVQRYPVMWAGMDEYPAVPFYTWDERTFFYDSSSLAGHLDRDRHTTRAPLLPTEAHLAALCRLIDEAFDEFGLYMVHHMRWVGSARTTPMGDVTAGELRAVLPPGLQCFVAQRLCQRQVARCPYLFSLAPPGYDAGLPVARTPPSRVGFPPTHRLLEQAWRSHLDAMEQLLSVQPYLLGERFTLADASAYGQLGMNLIDPEACQLLRKQAPRTYAWLSAIREGQHAHSVGELAPTLALRPLIEVISETFLPLMAQNECAWKQAVAAGETLFNEAAFRRNRALYDGHLLGYPFRAVVKTFQVGVWQQLQAVWHGLDDHDLDRLDVSLVPAAVRYLTPPTSALTAPV